MQFMCPFCLASASLMAGSVVSTGGLTALLVKILGKKQAPEEFVAWHDSNPKEETWAK